MLKRLRVSNGRRITCHLYKRLFSRRKDRDSWKEKMKREGIKGSIKTFETDEFLEDC